MRENKRSENQRGCDVFFPEERGTYILAGRGQGISGKRGTGELFNENILFLFFSL